MVLNPMQQYALGGPQALARELGFDSFALGGLIGGDYGLGGPKKIDPGPGEPGGAPPPSGGGGGGGPIGGGGSVIPLGGALTADVGPRAAGQRGFASVSNGGGRSGGESGSPVSVHVSFANGMEWLGRFVDVRVLQNAEPLASRIGGLANTRARNG